MQLSIYFLGVGFLNQKINANVRNAKVKTIAIMRRPVSGFSSTNILWVSLAAP